LKNSYKTPWHVRQYVKKELLDYKSNKKLIEKYRGDSRGLILANMRISQIEAVLNSLSKDDREAAEMIFIKKIPQSAAELKGLSKAAYYNVMNKVIFLTAVEMDLI
jgi:hypothetical protein